MALVDIQKCLVLLQDYLGPNTKKLWLQTHIHLMENMLLNYVAIYLLASSFIQ